MDILNLLSRAIDQLPDGQHMIGLRSVMKHISVASKYLQRGQEIGESDLYTDVIYRTNQAFEGSLKEAYRVLADADPARKTPDQIETYLKKEKLLSDRVVVQLTRYRQEWRNPSTHDYTLSFDESEAFLALTSVSSFAKVLIDQITISLAQKSAKRATVPHGVEEKPLLEVISAGCAEILNDLSKFGLSPKTEVELIGILRGYFSSYSEIEISSEKEIEGTSMRPDLLCVRNGETVFVELKRSRLPLTLVPEVYNQAEAYIEAQSNADGVIVLWNPDASDYEVSEWPPEHSESQRLRAIFFESIGGST